MRREKGLVGIQTFELNSRRFGLAFLRCGRGGRQQAGVLLVQLEQKGHVLVTVNSDYAAYSSN